jgi:predicted KAP-like P-loop ATPase
MNIHTDKPASIQSEDCFQRYEFSKRIASIVAKPQIDKSLIVGLYGKWGEGKTTVMNFIQQELPKDAIIVKFNPWLFSDEKHLLASFFTSIAEALGESDKTKTEKIGELLSDYSGAIGSITQYVGFNTDGLEKLGNKLKSASTEQLKTRIDELIVKSDKNIVVFVDDIDRLDINEIQYVFKLVKLVGDFPRTCYILSFDDEMVSAALAPRYGGNRETAGYNFLEKIIQIPLKIPKASKKALANYTLDLINHVLDDISIVLNKGEYNDFLEIFNCAFLPIMDNPRLGIRYANTLSFSLPLLKGEVNISNMMVVEGLKIFYPTLYDFMRTNSPLLLERTDSSYSGYDDKKSKQEEIKRQISLAINNYDEKKQKIIIQMLEQLFPQLKIIYSNSSYPEKMYITWAKEKKICSEKYFDRYFSYTVQEGEIPDNYLENLLLNLKKDNSAETIAKLNKTTESYSAYDLIQKLRMQEEVLNEVQSTTLALSLSEIGENFPREDRYPSTTTYSQSAILIMRLVRNVPKDKQLKLVSGLLRKVKSLEYAMEIHYWLMYQEGKNLSNVIFSEVDKIKIQDQLVSAFKSTKTDNNFFSKLSDGNLWEILSWWARSSKHRKSLQTLWEKHLKKKNGPEFALRLLKVFTPTISMTSSAGPGTKIYKSGFYESNFKAIEEVVDVILLNENLLKMVSVDLTETDPKTISDRDPINDETLISVFQWFINRRSLKT